jgi:lactoylglutathione lyase
MKMTDQTVIGLGYVLLYVEDVEKTLAFYERAFGLSRRFFHDDDGKAYGELETGATRLGFVSHALAADTLGSEVKAAAGAPSFEVAFTTADVPALFSRAVEAGAEAVKEPTTKPWGQTVSYVRDLNGFLVEICTPMP